MLERSADGTSPVKQVFVQRHADIISDSNGDVAATGRRESVVRATAGRLGFLATDGLLVEREREETARLSRVERGEESRELEAVPWERVPLCEPEPLLMVHQLLRPSFGQTRQVEIQNEQRHLSRLFRQLQRLQQLQIPE